MKTLTRKQSIAVGILFFGMLFGAGNIIFPVFMGQNAGANYIPAALGFLITGIGLPVLAVISFSVSKKPTLLEYARIGGIPFSYFFSIVLLLTIGPLFAIPRTATVAFEVGIHPFIKGDIQTPLLIYSTVFFVLALVLALRPSKLMDIIVRFLSPVFLVLIFVLIGASVFFPMGDAAQYAASGTYATIPTVQGVLDGYQTMDVLASLAFGSTIMINIRQFGVDEDRQVVKETAKASIATIVVMSVLYLAFTFIGSTTQGVNGPLENGGLILSIASGHFFGLWGQVLLALIMFAACLKTAIGLIVSIGETFEHILPGKISYRTWAFVFSGVSLFIANFTLDTILALSLPVLMFLYPLAIALIILWYTNTVMPLRKLGNQLILLVTAIPAFFDFLKAAPSVVSKNPVVLSLLEQVGAVLPFAKIGMGWLLPFGVAYILALLLLREKKER